VQNSKSPIWFRPGTIATLFAIAGVALAVRAFLLRNQFLGVQPAPGVSTQPAHYPDPTYEPVLFPGVVGEELPNFDLTDHSTLPIQLTFEPRSLIDPFVFRGYVSHDDPSFKGAMITLYLDDRRVDRETGEAGWVVMRISKESTIETDGLFPFRLECEQPPEPGEYRLRFEATHLRAGVKIDPQNLDDALNRVPVAEGTIVFRE
jgi:hypothetical protein